MDMGINELFEGVTITRGENKTVLPPSSFAEAQLAFMKPEDFRNELERAARESLGDKASKMPTLARAAKKHGARLYDALEERVREDHEGALHLLEGDPIIKEGLSGGGIFYIAVKRRGDERKARHREVSIMLDEEGNIIKAACQCETYLKNLGKSNYGKMVGSQPAQIEGRSGFQAAGAQNGFTDLSGFPAFNVDVVCYHIAAALTHVSREKGIFRLPYQIETDLAIEALYMDKVSRKKEATIDDYLFGQSVMTEETRQQISDGERTLEVIKHMKNIEGNSQEIIRRLRKKREGEGYRFAGFATNFRGTPYKTSGIVLTKPDGRSVHILHDSSLGFDLPLMMLKVPINVWIEVLGKEPIAAEMPENSLQSFGRYVTSFDERTQREVVSIITRPEAELVPKRADREAYKSLMPVVQQALPQMPK